jgi:hypothetical protein
MAVRRISLAWRGWLANAEITVALRRVAAARRSERGVVALASA